MKQLTFAHDGNSLVQHIVRPNIRVHPGSFLYLLFSELWHQLRDIVRDSLVRRDGRGDEVPPFECVRNGK